MLPIKAQPILRDPRYPLTEPLLLVSFPKSGNTWVRIFLSNYLADEPNPLDLDDLRFFRHIADPSLFELLVGYNAADLGRDEVKRLRAKVHGQLRHLEGAFPSYKVHDAFLQSDGTTPFFPQDCGRIVYLVRNPLDVCVSVMFHFNLKDLDQSLSFVAGAAGGSASAKQRTQLPQYFGSWSDHVLGWTQQPELNLMAIRYEDLSDQPEVAFAKLVAFLGLPNEPERMARALKACQFDRLQSHEQKSGFRERVGGTPFFRSGKVGDWRHWLQPSHVDQLIQQHGPVMRQFGYLDPTGLPV